jgi:hypothetical protein
MIGRAAVSFAVAYRLAAQGLAPRMPATRPDGHPSRALLPIFVSKLPLVVSCGYLRQQCGFNFQRNLSRAPARRLARKSYSPDAR